MNLTKQSHDLITAHFQDKAFKLAIDATCGNGNDSLFLCQHADQVLCFDVQAQAIENTASLLKENAVIEKAQLLHCGHENIEAELNSRGLTGQIDAAMFNFGYLPKSDDLSITTKKTSSAKAITQTLATLSDKGVVSLLCYRGHEGGAEEYAEVEAIVKGLNSQDWQVDQYDSFNPTDATPLLLFIQKRN